MAAIKVPLSAKPPGQAPRRRALSKKWCRLKSQSIRDIPIAKMILCRLLASSLVFQASVALQPHILVPSFSHARLTQAAPQRQTSVRFAGTATADCAARGAGDGSGVNTPTASWDDIQIPSWLKTRCIEVGYSAPSKVQSASLPVILEGKDAVIQAETGDRCCFGTGLVASIPIPQLRSFSRKRENSSLCAAAACGNRF